MARIPVNPERRDPGFLRKKADVGLSNVDNISAADFVNTVAEDVKMIGNQKVESKRINSEGKEFYMGILKTPELSAHAIFSTGLYIDDNPAKELAQFRVDFSFSTVSPYDTGKVSYTIQLTDGNKYLKDLELIFSQVGGYLYITLHAVKMPLYSSDVYFNKVGTKLLDWTPGTIILEPSTNYGSVINNGIELKKVTLESSHSSIQPDFCESLPVYDSEGNRVLMESRNYTNQEMETYDYPTINGVPFIARKDMKIGNRNAGRNIEVTAKHQGSDLSQAGYHKWNVLEDLRTIGYKYDPGKVIPGRPVIDSYLPDQTSPIENNDVFGYGLCRPSKYYPYILKGSYDKYIPARNKAIEWLNALGEDSDVITVGMFRYFMEYMFSQVFENMNIDKEIETKTVYSMWSLESELSDTQVDCYGKDVFITLSASRTKTTYTYVGGIIDDSKTTTEYETADGSQFSVSGITPTTLSITKVSVPGQNKWSISIDPNEELRSVYFRVSVDKGETSELTQVFEVKQTAFVPELLERTVSLDFFNIPLKDRVIPSTGISDLDICFSYMLTEVWSDFSGSSITKNFWYVGDNCYPECNGASINKLNNGLYKLSFPENTTGSDKTYNLSFKYEDPDSSDIITVDDVIVTLTQPADTTSIETLSTIYVFSSSICNCTIPAESEEVFISNISSYGITVKGTGDVSTFNCRAFFSATPEWISNYRIDESGNLYITPTENTDYEPISRDLILTQETGNILAISVLQSGKTPTVVSKATRVYSFNIDSDTVIRAEGDTRSFKITYQTKTLFSDNTAKDEFYSGEDVSVDLTKQEGGGSGVASVSYDGSLWNIVFPSQGESTTYNLRCTYNRCNSSVKTLRQGGAKVSTSYVFQVSDGETTRPSVEPIESILEIPLKSYSIDKYSDGTEIINSGDLIEFYYDIDSSCDWITDLNREENKIKLSIKSNSGVARTGIVTAYQNISGKSLTIYVTQKSSELSYYIEVNGERLYDGSELNIRKDSGYFQDKFTIVPYYSINGIEYSGNVKNVHVSGSSSWLEIVPTSRGRLTLTGYPNTTGSERFGVVYISYGESEVGGEEMIASLIVTQNAGEVYFRIGGEDITGTYQVSKSKESQTLSLSVESNYSYVINGEYSWVSIAGSSSKAAGVSTVSFNLQENTNAFTRVATFELVSEKGTSVSVEISQTSRKYYIDIIGYEGQDLYLMTSEWKPSLIIPISSNTNFMIDHYSSDLKVKILKSIGDDWTFTGSVSEFSGDSESTNYLYVIQNDPSNYSGEDQVISLSYYDSDEKTIQSSRKIHIKHVTNSKLTEIWGTLTDSCQILPYNSKEVFVKGSGESISFYAYTKTSQFKAYVVNKNEVPEAVVSVIEGSTSETPKSNDLTKLTVSIPKYIGDSYRKIQIVLIPSGKSSVNNTSGILPVYTIYQYPDRSLSCSYSDGSISKVISNEGGEFDIISNGYGFSGKWDLYNSEIPGWIELNTVYASLGGNITIKVKPNTSINTRSVKLQFWCDSDLTTLNTITVNQEGALVDSEGVNPELDYTVYTASTQSKYLYIYKVSEVSYFNSINSLGETVQNDRINYKITKTDDTTYKITFNILSENSYYNKDIYKIFKIKDQSNNISYLYIKNPRSKEIKCFVTSSGLAYDSYYSNAVYNYKLTSNIGLKGFIQSTSSNAITGVDYKTNETDSKASSTPYYGSLYNPSKVFALPQVMDKLLLRNMDIIPEYIVEVPVMLPQDRTSLPNRAIEVWIDDDQLFDISNYSASDTNTIYLPSNSKTTEGTVLNTPVYFKAYDSVKVSYLQSGKGFVLMNDSTVIANQVGSLGYITLKLQNVSDNTGINDLYLGSITLTLANGIERIIQVYQSADYANLVGNPKLTNITSSDPYSILNRGNNTTNLVYDGKGTEWTVEFTHEYPNWMILDLDSDNSEYRPTFNGSSYSNVFGSGGNSGTATKVTSGKYNSSVGITSITKYNRLYPNETFELTKISNLGVVSTYSTNNITSKSNVRGYINIVSRPVLPNLSLYNMAGTLVKDTEGYGSGTLTSSALNSRYSLQFRVKSNYIDICKNYIGKTIELEGQEFYIETEYDVFKKLFTGATLTYLPKGGSEVVTSPVTSFTTGIDELEDSYADFTISFGSRLAIVSGSLSLGIKDFLINSSSYVQHENINLLNIPIVFYSIGGGTIGGGTIDLN